MLHTFMLQEVDAAHEKESSLCKNHFCANQELRWCKYTFVWMGYVVATV